MQTNDHLYHYLATSSALLSIATSGMHFGWPSPSIPKLTSNQTNSFHITNDEGSWIVVMQLIAPIPSSILGALVVNIIGRKKLILLAAFPYIAAWLLIAFANSAIMLGVARFLAGTSDGIAYSVIPIYLAEVADPKIRGLLGAMVSPIGILGILLINVLGSYLSIRMTAFVSLTVPLLFLVTFIWMPDTPYFLIMKKNIDGARGALKKFKGRENVEEEIIRLKEVVNKQTESKNRFSELLTKKNNQKGLAIIAITRTAQCLSGITAIIPYTLSIFQQAGDFVPPLTATIICVSIQCVTSVVCSMVIDKVGRKPLLIASLIGSAISLLVEGSYFYVKDFTSVDVTSFTFVPLVGLMGFIIAFHLGAQCVPLLMQGELLPMNVKSFGGCFSETYYCVLAATVAKCFQIVSDSFGMFLTFYVFAACCVGNTVLVVLFVPETKGKTLEEIQDYLKGQKNR